MRLAPSLNAILAFNAGYVDTAGFLALHGLLTAHVTGNFVTLGASLVSGGSGALAKLLALPAFCTVVVLLRLAVNRRVRGLSSLRQVLIVQALILALAAVFWSVGWRSDLVVGLTLIAAMAFQNAAQRDWLKSDPPTTLMTGTTTQIMLDMADRWSGHRDEASLKVVRTGPATRRLILAVAAFALGCAGGAVGWRVSPAWVFLIPPALALWAAWLGGRVPLPLKD